MGMFNRFRNDVARVGATLEPVLWLLVLYEIGMAARQPVVAAWLNEHVGSEMRATVLSVEGMAFTLGGSCGLFVLGLVARAHGIPAAWLACAAVFLVMAPLYLLLGRIARRDAARRCEPPLEVAASA